MGNISLEEGSRWNAREYGEPIGYIERNASEGVAAGLFATSQESEAGFYLRVVKVTHEGDYVWTKQGVDLESKHLNSVVEGLSALRDSFATGKPTAIIERAQSKQVRVYANAFRGEVYVHVRVYFRDTQNHDWQPGRGISVRFEQLDELLDLLAKLR